MFAETMEEVSSFILTCIGPTRQPLCELKIQVYRTIQSITFFEHSLFYNSSFLSSFTFPDSLLHCSAVWSGQCDPHRAVAAPTVWWWGSSQLHHHCQSRCWYIHHQWDKHHGCCCTLQRDTHCQYCGLQLQWKQQCYHGDHQNWYVSSLGKCMFIC